MKEKGFLPPETARVPNAIERSVVLRTHTDIPEQMERERAIIFAGDGASDKEARGLPTLGDNRVRYRRPKGELFIKRYRDTGVRMDLTEGESAQLEFDTAKFVEGKWARVPDAETAIRYCDHIADGYDKSHGTQTLSVLAINRLIHDLSRELQADPSVRLQASELEERAVRALVAQGYDRAVSFDKIFMANEIVRALQKDSMGRENPSRGRIILANVRPRLTKMLLGNENKRNKYRYLGAILYRERERERFALSQVSSSIKDLGSMSRRDFQSELSENAVRSGARDLISPEFIKIAPYVQVAAEARFLMTSRRTQEDIQRLGGYVGYDRAQELAELPSYYDLQPHERRQRLSEIAESIDQELEFADTQLPLAKAA